MILVDVLLELIEVQLVSILKSAIAFWVPLDCVVSEMHELVFAVIKLVLEGRCSKITLLEEKHLHILVN